MEDVLKQVRAAFTQAFQCDPALVIREAGPEQIPGWDSLGHAELVGALESEFALSFDVDEIMDMENVAAIVRIVSEKQGATTG